jgi:hypothetical protein
VLRLSFGVLEHSRKSLRGCSEVGIASVKSPLRTLSDWEGRFLLGYETA